MTTADGARLAPGAGTAHGARTAIAHPALAAERQARIAALVRRLGGATVAALARSFGVSPSTVRRDLETLAEHGQLHRIHGGAVALEVIAALDPDCRRER